VSTEGIPLLSLDLGDPGGGPPEGRGGVAGIRPEGWRGKTRSSPRRRIPNPYIAGDRVSPGTGGSGILRGGSKREPFGGLFGGPGIPGIPGIPGFRGPGAGNFK